MEHRIRAASIILKDNRILLIKHVHPETGFTWWVPPGGGVEEQDKSIFDCAKRETFEETNLVVNTDRIIYIREFFSEDYQNLNIEFFILVNDFQGEESLENLKGNGQDEFFIKEVKWFSKEELQGDDVVVFPEILRDEFWDDCNNNFQEVKYLGRQA